MKIKHEMNVQVLRVINKWQIRWRHCCNKLTLCSNAIHSVNYPGYKCVILGDFNFQCDVSHRGFREFMPVTNNLNLCVCDSLDANSVGFTYSHSTLEHKSLIDHVFVNNDLLSCVGNYRIVQEATNLSDHLPILFTARCTLVQSAVLRSHVVCLSVRLSVCL